MRMKTILALVGIIAVAFAGWYLSHGSQKGSSFVFIFPREAKAAQIESDLKLLKKRNYAFFTVDELSASLKNKAIPSKTAVIVIEQPPTRRLRAFLKSKNIPVVFFIGVNEATSTEKAPGQTFGLRLSFPDPKPKPVASGYISINFDDGWESVYENALPTLAKESMPATAFIIPQSIVDENANYMNPSQLRSLQSSGWELGSHSYEHEHFGMLSTAAANRSLATSKSYLQGLGLYIYGFAFPYGEYKPETLLLANEYYGYVRLSDDNFDIAGRKVIDSFVIRNSFSLNWLKAKIAEAKSKHLGLVLLFHEVSNDGRPYSVAISRFKEATRIIKDSGLPVYSNVALLGKPLFLRQEYGDHLESEVEYVKRMRFSLRSQRSLLERAGIRTRALLYPQGVVTGGLIKAAQLEGVEVAFGGTVGHLTNNLSPYEVRTVTVSEGILRRALAY